MSDETVAFRRGETIEEHADGDGAISACVSEIKPGTDTQSVTLARDDLTRAIEQDCGDSYDDVFVHSNGATLGVTDHHEPTDAATVPSLTSDLYTESNVVRAAALETPADAAITFVDRDVTLTALAELQSETVTVHVDTDFPLFIAQPDNRGVVIAPLAMPEIGRDGRAVADGGERR
jgi:hypothetical protein